MRQQTGQAAEVNEDGMAAALAETGTAEAGLAAEGRTNNRNDGTERKRVEAVVETLSNLRGEAESLADVAHDARNMVTALGLYCDLLEEPGVLAAPYLHYAGELRLVATASRQLVEKLLALDLRQESEHPHATGFESGLTRTAPSYAIQPEHSRHWELMPAEPINNLAEEVLANRNLLAALAGPAIALTVDAEGGALPVRLTSEDLTRILVNLVKNATEAMEAMEAMPAGGRIQIRLHELPAATGTDRSSSEGWKAGVPTDGSSSGGWKAGVPTDRSSSVGWKAGVPTDGSSSEGWKAAQWLALTIIDNGPGIPPEALENIFEPGYSTRLKDASRQGNWSGSHRGLGLAITRSILKAAGGDIHATNHAPAGTRFEIELPVRSR